MQVAESENKLQEILKKAPTHPDEVQNSLPQILGLPNDDIPLQGLRIGVPENGSLLGLTNPAKDAWGKAINWAAEVNPRKS